MIQYYVPQILQKELKAQGRASKAVKYIYCPIHSEEATSNMIIGACGSVHGFPELTYKPLVQL